MQEWQTLRSTTGQCPTRFILMCSGIIDIIWSFLLGLKLRLLQELRKTSERDVIIAVKAKGREHPKHWMQRKSFWFPTCCGNMMWKSFRFSTCCGNNSFISVLLLIFLTSHSKYMVLLGAHYKFQGINNGEMESSKEDREVLSGSGNGASNQFIISQAIIVRKLANILQEALSSIFFCYDVVCTAYLWPYIFRDPWLKRTANSLMILKKMATSWSYR